MNPILFLRKCAFALLFVYAQHWDKWIREVEDEYEMSCRRNVLKRRH